MIKTSLAALAFIGFQAASADALTVNTGDVIRGAYSFPATGIIDLGSTSFLLRLSSPDLFGGTDSVGVRYLDTSLNPLSVTRFDADGIGLDPTIGILFGSSDFLPGASSVPQVGFVEIIGLAGSFEVAAIDLFATERVGTGILRQNRVTDFSHVAETPATVALPAAGWLLIAGVAALSGAGRLRRAFPQARQLTV